MAAIATRTANGKDIKTMKFLNIFTTGQIAKLLQVAPRTVSKWTDSGKLKGYKLPGSMDRRIYRADLIRFMRHHDMREQLKLILDTPRVVCVGASAAVVRELRLAVVGIAEVVDAQSMLTAGRELSRGVDIGVLDMHVGSSAIDQIVAAEATRDTKPFFVGLSHLETTDSERLFLKSVGVNAVIDPPWEAVSGVVLDALDRRFT